MKKCLLICFLLPLLQCQTTTVESIVEENLVPYENDYVSVNLNSNIREVGAREEAFRLYGLKRYSDAQIMFESAFRQTADKELRFFNANVLAIQGKHDLALQVLDNVRVDSKYYIQSLWLKVLVLVKLDNFERAEKLLTAYLLLDTEYKSKEAKLLLELIQRKKE